MKQIFLFFLLFFTAVSAVSAADPDPSGTWTQYASPEQAGWSSEGLRSARNYADSIGSDAVMVIYRGRVLASWGEIDRRFLVHSVRKSFISALYGIHVDEGLIDIGRSVASYGVDDITPLSGEEKTATVRDLLMARSGIYIPAAAEAPQMKNLRPKRGSHAPGTFWYYNNWDFNVLGTILEERTGRTVFDDLYRCLAVPLGMEDFLPRHGADIVDPDSSRHAAYMFRMSARDMARFGQLYLNEGRWNGQQIISSSWVRESVTPHSDATGGYARMGAYGYLWWIANDEFKEYGTYTAAGAGGHYISVLPGRDLVFVHRVNTFARKFVSDEQRLALLRRILDAQTGEPVAEPELLPLRCEPRYQGIVALSKKYDGLNATIAFPQERMSLRCENGELLLVHRIGTFALLPKSETDFIVEDLDLEVTIDLNEHGAPTAFHMHVQPQQTYSGTIVS